MFRRPLQLATVLALTMIVPALLPGGAMAAPAPRGGVVVTPPFLGSSHSQLALRHLGCGSTNVSMPLTANLTAGSLAYSGSALARSCVAGATVPTSSAAVALDQITWTAALPKLPGGAHRVVLVAQVGFRAEVALSATGACPAAAHVEPWGIQWSGRCTALASVNVWGNDTLLDRTNGSHLVISDGWSPPILVENTTIVDYGCRSSLLGGGCVSKNSTVSTVSSTAFTASFLEIDVANGSLNSTHSYSYEFQGYVDLVTELFGWAHGWARSEANTTGLSGVHWLYLDVQ